MIYSVISATGSYIPKRKVSNEDFMDHEFYGSDHLRLDKSNREIIDKFQEITTIAERRYVADDLVTSDIAYYAAKSALETSGLDPEQLDYIIVAHNFGDIKYNNKRSDFVPSLASRVKFKLGIKNPDSVAYDIAFGCPGWLQAVIQADYFIKSGDAKKILVIGAEILSRVSDPHDRDSMLYSDGAGAVIISAYELLNPTGILAHKSRTDSFTGSQLLHMDMSYHTDDDGMDDLFLKMNGRKLYQYALETVPVLIKDCLDKCSLDIRKINKVIIHQANGKMDDAILKRLFELYGINDIPEGIMPMTISWLGNSSVATIPTLLDLLLKNKMEGHTVTKDEYFVFASVGAGMNINAVLYHHAPLI